MAPSLPVFLVCLLGVVLGCSTAKAQDFFSGAPGNAHPSQVQIESLLDQLGGLPAEYKADLGLNILEYNWSRIPAEKKLGALTAIFDAAPKMHYKANERYAAGQPGTSLAANDVSALEGTRMDMLDVQTRAVRLLLHDMPGKASDLFSEISLPARMVTCSDPMVDDLSSYYETLAVLMRDSRVKTIAGQPKADFFLTVVRRANDMEQIVPLVAIMSKLPFEGDDLRISTDYLAANIQRADASDREEVALSGSFLAGISELVHRMRDAQTPYSKLLKALRSNLTTNLSKSYCPDATAPRSTIASSFNRLLTPASPDSPERINPSELTTLTAAEPAVDPLFAIDDAAVGEAIRRILFANQARQAENYNSSNPSAVEPESSDVNKLLQFALSPVDEGAGCSLCQLGARAQIFLILQNALPSGRLLESWVNGEVDFLTSSPLEEEDPIAYLQVLKTLIGFARPVPIESRKTLSDQIRNGELPLYPVEEPEFVHKELRASANPVVRAYMTYEDLFHPAFVPVGSHPSH